MFYVGNTLWLEEREDWYSIPEHFTGCIRYWNGNLIWKKDGLNHREDGPAIICANGEMIWCFNSKRYGYGPNKPKNFPPKRSLPSPILPFRLKWKQKSHFKT